MCWRSDLRFLGTFGDRWWPLQSSICRLRVPGVYRPSLRRRSDHERALSSLLARVSIVLIRPRRSGLSESAPLLPRQDKRTRGVMHSPIPFISRLLWPNRRRASFHTLRETAPQAASKPESSERILEVIALAYEIQYQELMRSVAIAQGLVSAVTLSAALASPLLLIGARRSPSNTVFGLLLILYLGTLGNSLRHAFWAFCTKPIFRPAVRTSPTPGFMTHLFISTFESPQKYREYSVPCPKKLGSITLSTRHLRTRIWLRRSLLR